MSLQPGPEDPTEGGALTPSPSEEQSGAEGQPPSAPPAGQEQPPSSTGQPPAAPGQPPTQPPPPPVTGSEWATPPPPPAEAGHAAGSTPTGPPSPPPPSPGQGNGQPWGAPPPPAGVYGGTPSPYGPQGQGGGYGGPPPPSQPDAWGAGAQQGYPTGGYPPPGYGAPGYSAPGYGAPRQTDNKAVIGLVLAITSWLLCPVLPAIAALILAGQSNRAIDASGGALEGRTMNTATKWVSWLNIGLWVILLIVGAIFAGWALSQDSSVWNDWVDGSTEF